MTVAKLQIYFSHVEVCKEKIKVCLIIMKIIYNSYLIILDIFHIDENFRCLFNYFLYISIMIKFC